MCTRACYEVKLVKTCLMGCSRQTFPDHYKFCPYCGTKLVVSEVPERIKHLDPETKKEIEKIMGEITCSKDFKCYRWGLEILCKAKTLGTENLLECLEENSRDCEFSLAFGNSHFCKCPLRIYVAKKLKK